MKASSVSLSYKKYNYGSEISGHCCLPLVPYCRLSELSLFPIYGFRHGPENHNSRPFSGHPFFTKPVRCLYIGLCIWIGSKSVWHWLCTVFWLCHVKERKIQWLLKCDVGLSDETGALGHKTWVTRPPGFIMTSGITTPREFAHCSIAERDDRYCRKTPLRCDVITPLLRCVTNGSHPSVMTPVSRRLKFRSEWNAVNCCIWNSQNKMWCHRVHGWFCPYLCVLAEVASDVKTNICVFGLIRKFAITFSS